MKRFFKVRLEMIKIENYPTVLGLPFFKAGFALGSKIPTNIFPASSFKYKQAL